MDLGLKGRKAIVCAASKGLGRACADALAAEGVELVINARSEDALKRTADEIAAAHGVSVTPVACDITTPTGREQVLAASPAPDILVNNAGGPPPGDFRDWERDDWIKALDANMLTPIAQAVVDFAGSGRPVIGVCNGFQVLAEAGRSNPAGRVGDPAEFGHACAYLCSAHAGFVTGQNLLIDGGSFPGTL